MKKIVCKQKSEIYLVSSMIMILSSTPQGCDHPSQGLQLSCYPKNHHSPCWIPCYYLNKILNISNYCWSDWILE